MKNYKLYLFDFDYTLAGSSKGIVKCFQITLDKLELPAASPETICRTIGLPMREADRYMTPLTHFYPQTISLLTALKERGARTGIISSKTNYRIAEKFTQDGCAHLIDHIIGSNDVQNLKPSPEGIEAALRYIIKISLDFFSCRLYT